MIITNESQNIPNFTIQIKKVCNKNELVYNTYEKLFNTNEINTMQMENYTRQMKFHAIGRLYNTNGIL